MKMNPELIYSESRNRVSFEIDSINTEHNILSNSETKKSKILSKKEVMKYSKDPFWTRIRFILLLLFFITLILLVIYSFATIYYRPKCVKPLKWWQKTIIYQINVRAFKDSNSDGEGDIRGIIEKLDYIQNILGIDTILLYSFFPSAVKESVGHEITDHKAVDPRFGTINDFKALVEKLHKRDMKIIIDFMPTHTSAQHLWFQKSKDGIEEYSDYYIWSNSVNNTEDWDSFWSWDENRQLFYFHSFSYSEPNLNLNNHRVKQELKLVLEFWLKKKVDGFSISLNKILPNDKEFDESYNNNAKNLIKVWHKFIKGFGDNKCLLLDSDLNFNDSVENYSEFIDLRINNGLILDSSERHINGEQVENIIKSTISLTKSSKLSNPWHTWVTGNHNVRRLATRIGHNLTDAIIIIAFLSPRSTPIVLYGDEIGIEDKYLDTTSPRNEFSYKYQESSFYGSVMQWNSNTSTAGFSDSKALKQWLAIDSSRKEFNVETELLSNKSSHLKLFQSLVEFRKSHSESVFFGKTLFPSLNKTDLLVMVRIGDNLNGFLLAVNFNDSFVANIRLNETYLPKTGIIRIISSDSKQMNANNEVNHTINLTDFYIQSFQSILIDFFGS
jgi:glycosidase